MDTNINTDFIKSLLNFYLNKEKYYNNKYQFFTFEHNIRYIEGDNITDFDYLSYRNIFVLKTNLNSVDSKNVFCLFKTLFDNDDVFYYFDDKCMDNSLIQNILQKENISEEEYDIYFYDLKYINEWIHYITECSDNIDIDIEKHSKIPGVILYNNHSFFNDINHIYVKSQKVFTIQDIIDYF